MWITVHAGPDLCVGLKNIASYLNLPHTEDVRRLLLRGELKGFQVGRGWFAYRRDLDAWLGQQKRRAA